MNLKTIHHYIGIYFCLFILSFSLPFQFLPDIGSVLSYSFELTSFWLCSFFMDTSSIIPAIESDTVMLHIHLLQLIPFSFIVGIILIKCKLHLKKEIIISILAYYVACVLFLYGFDKVFKHQFMLPEPNVLYTPLGNLTKDIAFWSLMGSSKSYTFFSGMIEVIPAILLCFKRTRLLGTIVALMVLVHVFVLNVSFNISVKTFSVLLILMLVYILLIHVEYVKRLINVSNTYSYTKVSQKLNLGSLFIVLLLMLNASFTFIKYKQFNDDLVERTFLHGAYQCDLNNPFGFDKVFVHRQNYFIVQYKNGSFFSTPMSVLKSKKSILLEEALHGANQLSYRQHNNKMDYILINDSVGMNLESLPYKNLPLFEEIITWQIDN